MIPRPWSVRKTGSRSSETLGKGILYYAVKLPNGNILRFSRTNDVIFQAVVFNTCYLSDVDFT